MAIASVPVPVAISDEMELLTPNDCNAAAFASVAIISASTKADGLRVAEVRPIMLIVPNSCEDPPIIRCSARSPARLGLDSPDVTRITISTPCSLFFAMRNESIDAAVIMPTTVPCQLETRQYSDKVVSGGVSGSSHITGILWDFQVHNVISLDNAPIEGR